MSKSSAFLTSWTYLCSCCFMLATWSSESVSFFCNVLASTWASLNLSISRLWGNKLGVCVCVYWKIVDKKKTPNDRGKKRFVPARKQFYDISTSLMTFLLTDSLLLPHRDWLWVPQSAGAVFYFPSRSPSVLSRAAGSCSPVFCNGGTEESLEINWNQC